MNAGAASATAGCGGSPGDWEDGCRVGCQSQRKATGGRNAEEF